MRVTCSRRASGIVHFRASGRMRAGDLARLRARVLEALDAPGDLLLDMRGLSRWDIGLVQVVIAARRSADERGARTEVVCDEDAALQTRLAGLGDAAGL